MQWSLETLLWVWEPSSGDQYVSHKEKIDICLLSQLLANNSSPCSSGLSLALHVLLVRLELHINTNVMTHVRQKTEKILSLEM